MKVINLQLSPNETVVVVTAVGEWLKNYRKKVGAGVQPTGRHVYEWACASQIDHATFTRKMLAMTEMGPRTIEECKGRDTEGGA
jgi:hypothetical protein